MNGRQAISPIPNPCQRLKGLALRANLELLFGFFIYFPGGNSGLRKGFPDLHDSFISIESHGALIFNVGDDDCHGLSALGYDDLFLIAQDSLEQPAELFPPLGYMEGDVVYGRGRWFKCNFKLRLNRRRLLLYL